MAPKLPNVPCFAAFGVIFCPDVCSYFCPVCGGAGVHWRISELFGDEKWGSLKASHIKASHPHLPRFRVRVFRIFRVFRLFSFCGISSDPCFPGVGGTSAFSAFSRIGFESLISKIRPTGFRMTGLRWLGKKHKKNKTHKPDFHGIVPGFWGGFCLCVFLPHKEWPENNT